MSIEKNKAKPVSGVEQAARRFQQIRQDVPKHAPVVQPKAHKVYTQFTMPPGQLRLSLIDDPDWGSQLKAFMRAYGRIRSNDFGAKASEATFKYRMDVLRSTFVDLRRSRNIKTLSQLKPKLLPVMLELWEERGVNARARINYFNVMRWFWRVCGIEIEAIKTFEKFPGEYTIIRSATHDKSWTGNGVDIDQVMLDIGEIDPVAGRLAQAMFTYGLRLKESLRLQPHEDDKGDALAITRGTKTGRPRQLEFMDFDSDIEYRKILDGLKSEVPPETHLAWQSRSLKQAKEHMYYIARKVGLTKGDLGVTWHGLRHEWAIRQLETQAGVVAPVRGGITIDYRSLSDLRRKVSEGLGHHRIKITTAYYGSFLSMEREQAKKFDASWAKIEPAVEQVSASLKLHGLDNLYWIGPRALGAEASKTDAFEFALPPETDPTTAVGLASVLAGSLSQTSGLECTVHVWEALSQDKQELWATEAVPLYTAVAPRELMQSKLQEQRRARSKRAA